MAGSGDSVASGMLASSVRSEVVITEARGVIDEEILAGICTVSDYMKFSVAGLDAMRMVMAVETDGWTTMPKA